MRNNGQTNVGGKTEICFLVLSLIRDFFEGLLMRCRTVEVLEIVFNEYGQVENRVLIKIFLQKLYQITTGKL